MPEVQVGREQKIVLAIIAFAMFMATLDTSIVNISLPAITDWFDTDMATVSWVVMAYLIVISGLMLACGRLGDLKGFRRVFIAGFALFTLGSLLCGLAPSIPLLIAFRIVQGAGAAAIEAIAPALIAVCLPAEKRGWALGILMTVVSIGIAAGPVLGGSITEFLGWHWIFFVNVPVGALAVVLSMKYLPPDGTRQKAGTFDIGGAGLLLLALGSLLFPLNRGLYLGWTSPVILGSFLASFALFTLFLLHERRCESPLVDLDLFSSRDYLRGNIAGMLVLLAFAGSDFLLPFTFTLVQGFSTQVAGMLLAVPAVALVFAGPAAGKFSDRYGPRRIMAGSALLCGATLFAFSLFNASTGTAFIVVALGLYGLAVGLFMPPNMSLILGAGSSGEEGVASGVMMTLRNIGAVLGIAVFGTIAMGGTAGSWAGPNPSPAELVPGFRAAFLAGMAVCIIVVAVSASVGGKRAGPGAGS
jgi:DHA2 family metal-tetracycline-proton antiporter-like MFS transporter